MGHGEMKSRLEPAFSPARQLVVAKQPLQVGVGESVPIAARIGPNVSAGTTTDSGLRTPAPGRSFIRIHVQLNFTSSKLDVSTFLFLICTRADSCGTTVSN